MWVDPYQSNKDGIPEINGGSDPRYTVISHLPEFVAEPSTEERAKHSKNYAADSFDGMIGGRRNYALTS